MSLSCKTWSPQPHGICPEAFDVDWHAASILNHVYKEVNDVPRIHFKVLWHSGIKQWVRMDDLRLQDPFLVIRYGMRNKLTNKRGWSWVTPFLESDELTTNMLRAYKVATKNAIKFGVRVPMNPRQALRFDREENNKLWQGAIDKELAEINQYETFRALTDDEPLPPGYK